MDDLDQLLRGLGTRIIARGAGIDQMLENVIFDDLGDKSVQRAPAGGRPWQQAVFWGLRLYIVAMLAIIAVGFARVAIGQ